MIYEFNKFCSGEHPAFNGRNGTPLVKFDGSKNCKELRITDPSQKGYMYRGSTSVEDAKMVTGNHKRCDPSELALVNED
jgi:hypothetical protein